MRCWRFCNIFDVIFYEKLPPQKIYGQKLLKIHINNLFFSEIILLPQFFEK